MTDQPTWDRVDEYLCGKLLGFDGTLAATLADSEAAHLPAIAVSPLQGRFLELIARSTRAGRVLEIGTLGGYSTICLARGVGPDGRVVSIEYEPRHARVAESSIARAGLSGVVEIKVGRALDVLRTLSTEATDTFDLVFIDADKASNAAYVDAAIRLSHSGTVIIVDNVVRGGAVADPAAASADVRGTRAMFDLLEGDHRLDATAMQTVGSKGYDGFVYALVR